VHSRRLLLRTVFLYNEGGLEAIERVKSLQRAPNMSGTRRRSGRKGEDRYGPSQEADSFDDAYRLQQNDEEEVRERATPPVQPGRQEDIFRDEESEGDEEYEGYMSLSELLYSTSSFYAILVPGKIFVVDRVLTYAGEQA
jgi:hypothetical protein